MRTKIIAALLFVVLIGTVSIYYAFKPLTAEGVVDHKAITGEKGNAAYTILVVTDTGTSVKNIGGCRYFLNSTIVDESLEKEIRSEYVDITYVVSVRTEYETMAYRVSREDFHKVDPGDTVKFKIVKFKLLHKRDDIVRIIRVIG